MNILILEGKHDYSPNAVTIYRALGNVRFWEDDLALSVTSDDERKDFLAHTNVLVVRLRHKIDFLWMDKMPNLKIIATNTTGLNHIDTREAKKRKIKIISLKGRTGFLKHIPSTAEMTWGLILALARNIPWAYGTVTGYGNSRGVGSASERWNRDAFKGNQLAGKTLGIIGFGRLGKIVAQYAKAFRMNVLFYDPYKKTARSAKKALSLEELCKRADIISMHASYDQERPEVILQRRHFALMKEKTPYVVNTARGELVDEEALLCALKEGWIKGAALDVMAREDMGGGKHLSGNELYNHACVSFEDFEKMGRLIIVPHIGGATHEAVQITEDFIADIVKKRLQ
ncbi:MAG: hypothetical protein COU47_00640 [Candidatus Niyogibacteria bacterium CG10_big_fil_rev_8_21_14_0_10_46_36]|uniref:Hydroxyacid dehydrogenase n=1 Tax=Candidatus Niyogibacteria bacterium CG10_big_fil_rev_8_21_14_0_10_46_36 TaxID=1974726 RepID=A0A2H0TGI5_9BACT|nr:MAG: hypothetical protein COU47_00640 [Candidatus Niyogibacteria bacterium CG10_big_fil_rev_8_21_14_0_10_46_36]